MAALTKYYWIYDGGTTKYADDTVRTQDITLYQFFRDGFFRWIDSSKMTEAGYELRRREYKGTFDIHTRSDTITLTFNDGDKYRESIFTYAFHDDQLTVIEDTIGELTSVEIEE